MDHVTEGTLQELVEWKDDASVSIYMPTHRRGRETEQDRVRLKNLASKVEAQTLDVGMRGPDVGELLEPAHTLVNERPHVKPPLPLMPADGRYNRRGAVAFCAVRARHDCPAGSIGVTLRGRSRTVQAICDQVARFFDRDSLGEDAVRG